MQNYPNPNNPYGAPPPNFTPPGGQPPKKSKTPWIIGGVVGCLLLIIIGVVALVLLGVFAVSLSNTNANRSNINRPSPVLPSSTVRYVNSPAGLSGKLAENYVDFSFNYPNTWTLVPRTPNDSNFVKVEKSANNITQENFAVGYFRGSGTQIGDRILMPQLANQLSDQFARGFPNYTKVSEGATHIGAYDGYEVKFTGSARTPQGNLDIYGRAVLIPGVNGNRNGVTLIILATSQAPGITSVDDVGVKGDMPVIINSFRLGS